MRRKVLYLLVALLAFGIGSLVVFNFYRGMQKDSPKAGLIENFEIKTVSDSPQVNKTKQSKFVEIAFRDFPCEDENLKFVWDELRDRTVFINVDYLERIKDCGDLIEPDSLVGLNNDGLADLNNDGRKEIFIRSQVGYFCGNNCHVFWVFQQNDEKKLRIIFEQMGYMTIVENKKTNGYKDLRFEVHATYTYFEQKLFKFDGIKYIPTKCWSESKLRKNKDGDLVETKEYKTKYYECKETEWVNWN